MRSTSVRFFGRVGVPRAFVFADYKDASKPAAKVVAKEWVALSYPLVRTERQTDTGTATDTWVRCYSINAVTMSLTSFWVNTTTDGKPTFEAVKLYPH